MTLPQYTFINKTKFLAGKLALEQLPGELKERQCKTVLIVTDATSVKKGAVKALVGAFGRCDTTLLVFDKTRDTVQDAQVSDVTKIFRETQSSALIALGGPTVIDLARLANLELSLGTRDAASLKNTRGEAMKMKPLFVIPTYASTETCLSTPVSLLGNMDRKALNVFMPTAVIIDPRVMIPPSAKVVAEAGLSALFHAVEASIGPCSNPVSTSFAFAALGLLKESLVTSISKSSNKKCHLPVTSAVHLADAAFSNATSGLGVAFVRALSRINGIDANVTAALLLPALMKKRMETRENDVARILWALEGPDVYAETLAPNRAQAAIDAVSTLIAEIGKAGQIETSLSALEIINGNMEGILKHMTDNSESLNVDEVKMMLAS